MGEAYAPYPQLDELSSELNSPRLSDDLSSLSAAQSNTTNGKLRRHAACDECRKRKLKCSGEPSGCTRCVKNGIPCIYSQQKQMGRPRKRQKTDEGPHSPLAEDVQYVYQPPLPPASVQSQPQPEPFSDTPIDPSLSNIDQDLTDFQNVCSGAMAQTIRNQRESNIFRVSAAAENGNFFDQDSEAINLDYPQTRYPTDISLWPDFSTIDKLPLPLTTKFDVELSNNLSFPTSSALSVNDTSDTMATTLQQQPYYDPDADPTALSALPSVPACPCLPNLYLSLSTLSTLGSFPTSQHTVDTLLSAHKTAHSVIYCAICPRQFQSGSQNLMLGCTLLNVIADHWHRMRHNSPDVLKKGFGNPTRHYSNGSVANHQTQQQGFIGMKEGQSWHTFAKQLVRAYVFGDSPVPKPPSTASNTSSSPSPPFQHEHTHTPTPNTSDTDNTNKIPSHLPLLALVSSLERRQRQWHRLDDPTDEFTHPASHEYHLYGKAHIFAHMFAHGSGKGDSHIDSQGRPESIVEHAARVDDPNLPKPRKTNGNAGSDGNDEGEGGGASHDGDENNDETKHTQDHEHMLCLHIVSHSKRIIRALAEE